MKVRSSSVFNSQEDKEQFEKMVHGDIGCKSVAVLNSMIRALGKKGISKKGMKCIQSFNEFSIKSNNYHKHN